MSVLPKFRGYTGLVSLLSKSQSDFCDYRPYYSEIWKGKGTRIAKTILNKNNKVGGINLSKFKTSIAAVNTHVWLQIKKINLLIVKNWLYFPYLNSHIYYHGVLI